MIDKSPSAPWLQFPDIPAGDIGWRMGAGEQFLSEWWVWAQQCSKRERQHYLVGCRPIPHDWLQWAVEVYAWPDDDDASLDNAWEILAS